MIQVYNPTTTIALDSSSILITVLKELSYKYKGCNRRWKPGMSLVCDINNKEDVEEFIFLTAKDSPLRANKSQRDESTTAIRIPIQPQVIELIPKGVWLGKSWYGIEPGDELPLHMFDLRPFPFHTFNSFLLYKEQQENKFNLLVGRYAHRAGSVLIIQEVSITHLSGYTTSWVDTVINTPYTLKYKALKKLWGFLEEGLTIILKGSHLVSKAEALLSRTIYTLHKEKTPSEGVTLKNVYDLRLKTPMERMYDSCL